MRKNQSNHSQERLFKNCHCEEQDSSSVIASVSEAISRLPRSSLTTSQRHPGCRIATPACRNALRRAGTLPEFTLSEILRGVYPERNEILRFAQNDTTRRAQNDTSRRAHSVRGKSEGVARNDSVAVPLQRNTANYGGLITRSALTAHYRKGIVEQGFTILELMISSSILVFILGITFSFYTIATETYETGSAIVWAQTQLQIKMEEITSELIETSESNLTIYSWNDSVLGNQEALCFSSARDSDNNFVTNNGRPSWQSVVVYAPYANPNQNNRGEIRRYENFGTHNFPLDIVSIDTDTVTLSDETVFNRNSGRVILGNVATLDARALQIATLNPIYLSIDVKVTLPRGAFMIIPLQTSVNCRN